MMPGICTRGAWAMQRPAPRSRSYWTELRTIRCLRDASRQLAIWSMESKLFAGIGEYQPQAFAVEEVCMLLGDIVYDAKLDDAVTPPGWMQHEWGDASFIEIPPLQQAGSGADVHMRLAAVIGVLAAIATSDHAIQSLRSLSPRQKRIVKATLQAMKDTIKPNTVRSLRH